MDRRISGIILHFVALQAVMAVPMCPIVCTVIAMIAVIVMICGYLLRMSILMDIIMV
jgi:hypothetical protein